MAKNVKWKTRRAYTISTVSVTLVLFIVGLASSLFYAANEVTNRFLEGVKVSLMLDDSAPQERMEALRDTLKASPAVSRVEYISKAQAVEDFNADLGADFALLGVNPLPASLEVYLSKDMEAGEASSAVEKIAAADKDIIDEVVQQVPEMKQAIRNVSLFNFILLAFVVALLFVSIITINNTIRMSVFSRRFLMRTMMLVGATRGFIRRPFLMSAFWQGIISGLLATITLGLLFYGVSLVLPELLTPIFLKRSALAMPLLLIALGLIICLTSTFFAVNRYLRLNNNELFMY